MTLDDLAAFGADVDEGLARCMGNEAFYLRMVDTLRADGGFDELQAALDGGDLQAAFEAAHALKGVLANLSLTPVYEPVHEITELLRAGTDTDYAALMAKIMAKRDELLAL